MDFLVALGAVLCGLAINGIACFPIIRRAERAAEEKRRAEHAKFDAWDRARRRLYLAGVPIASRAQECLVCGESAHPEDFARYAKAFAAYSRLTARLDAQLHGDEDVAA